MQGGIGALKVRLNITTSVSIVHQCLIHNMTSKTNADKWSELDSLAVIFESTLRETTKVRNILALSNQQTLGLLSDWEIPENPFEEPVCTCNSRSSRKEEELNKIVKYVDQAVVNAQKIREKSEPQQRQKTKQKEMFPSVSCVAVNVESKKDSPKNSLLSKLGNTSHGNTMSKSRSTGKLVTQKIGENAMRKLPIKSSKTTYQKDFPVTSKSPRFRHHSASPRSSSRKETSAQDLSKSNDDASSSKQVSLLNVQKSIALSDHTQPDVDSSSVLSCPVHGKVPKRQSSNANLAEAVDVLGVPPEMVKYLRSYHSFVIHNQVEDKPTKMTKGKKAAEKFLGQLAEVNGWQWKDVEEEPVVVLFVECVPLFGQVFGAQELGPDVKDRMQQLDKKCQKWFNLSESPAPNVYSAVHPTNQCPLPDTLLINAVWNVKNKRQCKVLQYIRYSSPVQWRKLFKNMQDIQKLDLQLQVFEELEAVLPLLEECSPDDPSFMLLFKAICTVCDITKLCLPVIFKS